MTMQNKRRGFHWKPDMIRMMQIQFVAVASAILVIVFLIMLGSINLIMQTISQSQSLHLLIQIAESERYDSIHSSDAYVREHAVPPVGIRSAEQTGGFLSAFQNPLTVSAVWGEPYRGWEEWDNHRPPDDFRPPEEPTWEEFPTPPDMPIETQPPLPPTELPTELPTPEETEPPAPADIRPVEPEIPDIPSVPETPESETIQETAAVSKSDTETETVPEWTESITASETQQLPPAPREEPQDAQHDKWNLTITLDHFAILADHEGQFIGLRNTEDYTDEQAEEIMLGMLQSGEQSGMYGWLQYYMTEKEYGTLLVITDKTSDQSLLNSLFRTTVILGCFMLLVLFVFLCVFSRWIVGPVKSAFARQKQFVSDAGHELKTPLTILAANADILQDEIGENKWLGYMQEQTVRMNQLVGDLLRLARMDIARQEYDFQTFNLSTAITATVLPFESQAFEQNKNLELDIQPGVEYYGSEQHIRQLAAIFMDNALKYSDENGTIKVTLLRRKEQCILEFYNTGCEISPPETQKIFERFYRGDKARENKGKSGYGLGLAIARSIMDVHKIKIQVTCEQDGWIRFLLTM